MTCTLLFQLKTSLHEKATSLTVETALCLWHAALSVCITQCVPRYLYKWLCIYTSVSVCAFSCLFSFGCCFFKVYHRWGQLLKYKIKLKIWTTFVKENLLKLYCLKNAPNTKNIRLLVLYIIYYTESHSTALTDSDRAIQLWCSSGFYSLRMKRSFFDQNVC